MGEEEMDYSHVECSNPTFSDQYDRACYPHRYRSNAPEDSFGNSQSTVQAWTVVNLVLAVIAFLIDAVELSMYIHNDLSPKLYLCFNPFKFSILIIPFAWNIAMDFSAWQERGRNDIYLYVAIGLSSAVFASFIASLTYSLVVFRTYRKRARILYEKYSTSELGGSNSDVFYR